ncbi:hypothetical protein [Actinacidiphila glaucinigra]|uniref:hypothetical protein n=1 Tax=Actinacidiphila glaucinigra TaxID=235986 RepID=UPI002E37BD3B|nr:hypothetical protein [Actinacidiphila glaucinigra]
MVPVIAQTGGAVCGVGFGQTRAGAPGHIAEKRAADEAVKAASTVLFTVRNRLGHSMVSDAADRSEGDHDGDRRIGISGMMTR